MPLWNVVMPRSWTVLAWLFVLSLVARAVIDGARLWLAWGAR